MKTDYEGRQFVALHDIRGALVSASASPASGTAASLIAGDADYFLDIVEVSMSNQSTVAVGVALVNDGATIRTFQIPANKTEHFKFDVPLRQQTKATPWLADMDDVTGTTLVIEAILIKKATNNS